MHQLFDNGVLFQQFLNALERKLRILGVESARHMDQDGFGRLLILLRHDCNYRLGYRDLRWGVIMAESAGNSPLPAATTNPLMGQGSLPYISSACPCASRTSRAPAATSHGARPISK